MISDEKLIHLFAPLVALARERPDRDLELRRELRRLHELLDEESRERALDEHVCELSDFDRGELKHDMLKELDALVSDVCDTMSDAKTCELIDAMLQLPDRLRDRTKYL